jgi:hypothetical protein
MEALTGPVEDFLYQPIPSEVWHYTTLIGLQGILSSGTIWATEARSTNDATEFVHTRDIALEFLKTAERPNEHFEFALTDAYKVIESVFNKGALSVNETEVFIASFSAAEDLKSQWADYADRHRGVSIGFDLRNIRPPKGSGIGVTFAPCVYEQADKELLVRSALSYFVKQSANSHSQVTDKGWVATQMRDWMIVRRVQGFRDFDKAAFQKYQEERINAEIITSAIRTSFDLLRLASYCKNRSFLEEKEWRLALPRPKGRIVVREPVKYRGENGTIPYIQSNLFQPNGRLPITRVMLGPLCTMRNEVERLLSDNRYDVTVVDSSIPLRNLK